MVYTSALTLALKEWAVAVNALAQAETILLLRKGGIREQGFSVAQPQFWLYPTYEHQKPHLLKPEFASRIVPIAAGWHPESVEILAWAEVTHSFQISEAAAVSALLPFHIWTEEFVSERLKWKPRLPLSVLLLRTYRFAQPQYIPYRSAYGGCKSWIELEPSADSNAGLASLNLASLDLGSATPVLPEADYLRQVETITALINPSD
jgi:hypothetical protein